MNTQYVYPKNEHIWQDFSTNTKGKIWEYIKILKTKMLIVNTQTITIFNKLTKNMNMYWIKINLIKSLELKLIDVKIVRICFPVYITILLSIMLPINIRPVFNNQCFWSLFWKCYVLLSFTNVLAVQCTILGPQYERYFLQ